MNATDPRKMYEEPPYSEEKRDPPGETTMSPKLITGNPLIEAQGGSKTGMR